MARRCAVNMLQVTHSSCMAPMFIFVVLVDPFLFPATQYLCYLCMTVHIYMVGFLSPVIDFEKLEINYRTSLWSVIYLQVFPCKYFAKCIFSFNWNDSQTIYYM